MRTGGRVNEDAAEETCAAASAWTEPGFKVTGSSFGIGGTGGRTGFDDEEGSLVFELLGVTSGCGWSAPYYVSLKSFSHNFKL